MTATTSLAGVKVLDFSQMMLGPWGTQLLADLGADVIKVERPGSGDWERQLASMGEYYDGESPLFLAMNRNKRSLAIDLKDPESIAAIMRLAADADVIVENYRPGVMDRLGLGYDDFRRVKPAVVYASGSGYGRGGPYVDRPGQDLLIQAMSGLMAHTGPAGTPPISAGTAVFDASTALMLVIGVLAALRHVDQTGEGQRVDVSLLGTAVAMQCQEISSWLNLGQRWERSASSGVAQPWLAAPYGTYATSDGWIVIAMAPITVVADVLDLPELRQYGTSPREVFEHREELAALIAARMAQRRTQDWLPDLLEGNLWVAPINTFDEVLDDPQVAALGLLQVIDWDGKPLHVVATPIGLSATPATIRTAPPRVGEHNDEILQHGWGVCPDRDALSATPG